MATFSKRTLRELGDVLSDFSSLNPIARLFEDADIAFPPDDVADEASRGITGQRRTLVAQYIAGLDLGHPEDIRKLLLVFDEVFAEVLGAEPNEWTEKARKRLLRYLSDDGFVPGKDGRLAAVGAGRRVDIPLDTIADIGVLGEHLDRIDREVDSDPAGAIVQRRRS